MIEIIAKAVSMTVLIFLGYFLKKKGLVKADARTSLLNLVFYITLPCILVSNLREFEFSSALIVAFFCGFLTTLLPIFVSYIVYSRADIMTQRGCMINSSGYSMGTFTIPFIVTFLNPSSMIIIGMYDIGNSIMSLGGAYATTSVLTKANVTSVFKDFCKKLFLSVPFITYIVVFTLHMLSVKIPDEIYVFTNMAGDATIFIVMIIIGIMLEFNIPKEDTKDIVCFMILRLLCAVVFSLIVYYLLPIPFEYKKVIIICFFAPPATSSIFFGEKLGCKQTVIGAVNSLSIPVSMIIMTSLLILLK